MFWLDFFGFLSASTFLIGLLLISPKFLESSFQEMGFGDLTWETAPRALLMHASQDIAIENFPFGGGLGTFGGLSADVFDSNLYYKYNLSREWWFNERLFLRDTYWPKIIGESGFFWSDNTFNIYIIPSACKL
ncbi:MAG: hypothetical protein U5L01_10200 [Rheinheimera sp.]|nr:hypothetical protein [Rheinheimera sp.]